MIARRWKRFGSGRLLDTQASRVIPTGRFAPSPTGDLHFGSLLAALASCCEARSKGANWLLRIDDIDGPRSVAGSAERIQSALKRYGFVWDNAVYWQSLHSQRYETALTSLIELGLVFRCNCSRRSLPRGQAYPGKCRENRVRSINECFTDHALRLVLPDSINFIDGIQGAQQAALNIEIGDIIILRRDQLVSYSLACAVDDALDSTEVVRGADLLPSTAAQLAIIKYLQLQAPAYSHIPVAVNINDDKLSKHSLASPIDSMERLPTLQKAWKFLGQPALKADDVAAFWQLAIKQWRMSLVPKSLRVMVHDS